MSQLWSGVAACDPGKPSTVDTPNCATPLHAIVFGITINTMKAKLTGQGGPGRGQGRKPLPEGEAMVPVVLKMKPAQKDKLAKLGGAPWVRDRIDKAKLPKE